ncbi:MAG: oligosaccharide flippase family protein [archaeon]|nr:oligosaccharide flippase family protein [archaeon]
MAKNKDKNALELNVSLKTLARTSIIVLVGVILSKIFSYVYRIIVARYFGPEVYGLFSIATMILGLFVTVFSLGLVDGLLRFISIYRGKDEKEKINYLLKFSLVCLTISGVIAGVLLFAFSNFIALNLFRDIALVFYLKVFSFLIILSILLNTCLGILRAYERAGEYSFFQNISQNAIKIVLLFLFIFLGFNADNTIIFSFFLGVFITLIGAYIFCRKIIAGIFIKSSLKKSEKKEIRSSFFLYCWPIIFLGVISSFFGWIDSFAIGYFMSLEYVGFYNAALPIATLLSVAPDIFMQLFFPMINKGFIGKKYVMIKELSKQVQKWIFIINLPVLLMILIFPGVIINLLFGANYLVAENSLRILAIGLFFMSLSQTSIHLLSMLGKSKIALINVVVCSVINVALNILLIPLYGLVGAALATAISSIILGGAFIIQVGSNIKIYPFRRKMIRITLVSLIPTGLLIYLNRLLSPTILNMLLSGILFGLSYLFLIIVTGCLDKNDIGIITAFRKKIFGSN